MTTISFEHVSKSFTAKDGTKIPVLTDLSIEIAKPTFVAILGPNGCGKSTILNLIAGLLTPDEGSVMVRVNDRLEPNIGYVWQDYRASLLPWADTTDNITFPLRLRGIARGQRERVAQELLHEFRLGIRPDQPCFELSGGQQQLITILRSTVGSPDLLLLDEPLSALDQATSWTMAFHLERMWQKLNVPAVLVSHDVDEGILLADEILLIGRAQGRIEHRLQNPLPRPRDVKMLTAREHIQCREAVIEFLFEKGALIDQTKWTQAKLNS